MRVSADGNQRTPSRTSVVSWSSRSYGRPRSPSALVECVLLERVRLVGAVAAAPGRCATVVRGDFLHQRLDLLVVVPAPALFFQNQVGAHAAASEIFHTIIVLGTIGVRVEVAVAGIADILQELERKNAIFGFTAPKRKSWS